MVGIIVGKNISIIIDINGNVMINVKDIFVYVKVVNNVVVKVDKVVIICIENNVDIIDYIVDLID